jgi:hypothetical protein
MELQCEMVMRERAMRLVSGSRWMTADVGLEEMNVLVRGGRVYRQRAGAHEGDIMDRCQWHPSHLA